MCRGLLSLGDGEFERERSCDRSSAETVGLALAPFSTAGRPTVTLEVSTYGADVVAGFSLLRILLDGLGRDVELTVVYL